MLQDKFCRLISIQFFFLFTFAINTLFSQNFTPIATYLTWVADPTTTMTVTWITKDDETKDLLEIRKKSDQNWHYCIGEHFALPTDPNYLIHRVSITGLLPDTEYVFRIGRNGKDHQFRTMPKQLDKPISFVVGGDIYHDDISFVRETNRLAASKSPYFALLGGDIAYTSAKFFFGSENTQRWIDWLAVWALDMLTPEGNMIPILPVLGNHDVNGRFGQSAEKAKTFHSLFPMPGVQGYNVMDFGDYLSIILLDSGHTNPIEGKQTTWLYNTLFLRKHVPNQFAIYHVPAYPSVRGLNGKWNIPIRKHWVPIFQHFHINAAFEHHDHAYKRTYPLLNGLPHPQGVVYLGDGGWGVEEPRNPKKLSSKPYIAVAKPARHFILVSIDSRKRKYEAFESKGAIIDSYEQEVPFQTRKCFSPVAL